MPALHLHWRHLMCSLTDMSHKSDILTEGKTERLWEVAYSDGDHDYVNFVKFEDLLTAESVNHMLDQAEVTSGPSGVEVTLMAIT